MIDADRPAVGADGLSGAVVADPGYPDSARQALAETFGVADAGGTSARSLDGLVHLAARLLRADFCAINIFDGDHQVPLVTSLGIPVDVTSRASSVCQQAVRRCPEGQAFVATDLSQDPELRENPWVSGELGSVRFYAAAPLLDDAGTALGTVCVWSDRSIDVPADCGRILGEVRDSVVAVLRTRVAGLVAPVAQRLTAPGPGRSTRSAPPRVTIDAVIRDSSAIQTLFQPIVHLETGSVVGFEALSRGPAGSELESPMALLEAAKRAGRLGELDWACRVLAMERAADADLHPSLSWFINVEPASLESACPEHLLPSLARARRDLRVVLEIVERDVEGHVTHLLHAARQARSDAWGVALDDVGTNTASLALLPFLQPDVVKLDMSLVHHVPGPRAAAITADVRAYAERTGATVLAEGIESPEHERLARVFGATYGQGYRYGRPGRLPAAVPAPRFVVPLRQTPEMLVGSTAYESLSSRVTPQRARKADLVHISRHLEAVALAANEPSVVLASFQDRKYFTDRDRARYRALAEQHALTMVLAAGLDLEIGPRSHVGPGVSSRMHAEWDMILLGPRAAIAFVAKDCGDTGRDADRRFDFIYTFDRPLIKLAARCFLYDELLPPQQGGRLVLPEQGSELPVDRAAAAIGPGGGAAQGA